MLDRNLRRVARALTSMHTCTHMGSHSSMQGTLLAAAAVYCCGVATGAPGEQHMLHHNRKLLQAHAAGSLVPRPLGSTS